MKFSTRRKAKMRNARFKRAKKTYHSSEGCYIAIDKEVIDSMLFKKDLYLLTKSDTECVIIKVTPYREEVEMSAKKMLDLRKIIENSRRWKHHTKIELTEAGTIATITLAPKPWEKCEGTIYIFVEV